jgi:hypothetical protein
VAADVARRKLDIVHVHCVETLIPVIRRRVPNARIVDAVAERARVAKLVEIERRGLRGSMVVSIRRRDQGRWVRCDCCLPVHHRTPSLP